MPADAHEMHRANKRTETPLRFSIQLSPLAPLALLCFSLMISSARVTKPVIRLTIEPAKDSQGITSDDSPLGSRPGGRRVAKYAHQSSGLRISNPKIKILRRTSHPSMSERPKIPPETLCASLGLVSNATSVPIEPVDG